MSIRLIAKELYQLKKEKESLETRLINAPGSDKTALQDLLRRKSAEVKRLQEMLEGAKETPVYRKPR